MLGFEVWILSEEGEEEFKIQKRKYMLKYPLKNEPTRESLKKILLNEYKQKQVRAAKGTVIQQEWHQKYLEKKYLLLLLFYNYVESRLVSLYFKIPSGNTKNYVHLPNLFLLKE